MLSYKTLEIQWLDQPEKSFTALVGIGNWDQEENDERVFFYFANEEELEQAKQPNGIEEFRVIGGDC
jgi:hypothetical protein